MKRLIVLILFITAFGVINAQINISTVTGGGISDLQTGFPLSDNSGTSEFFAPGPLIQIGAAVSTTFRTEGMLSWEAQILLRRSTLRSVPIDFDKADCIDLGGGITSCRSPFPRDYSNVYRWNYWSVHIPASLNFQVFGPIGYKFGGSANFLLSKFPEKDKNRIGGNSLLDPEFESLNWQGHIGFIAKLGSKIRLETLAYSDFKPRLTYGPKLENGEPLHEEYRAMGLYLNVLYKLN